MTHGSSHSAPPDIIATEFDPAPVPAQTVRVRVVVTATEVSFPSRRNPAQWRELRDSYLAPRRRRSKGGPGAVRCSYGRSEVTGWDSASGPDACAQRHPNSVFYVTEHTGAIGDDQTVVFT